MDPVISVVAPAYNESASLNEFYRRIFEVMNSLGDTWELILVDDGSQDDTAEIIQQLAEKDDRVRPVIFVRNFGHQIAVTAGLDFCRGQAAVIIDSDLQDPPELIPELIERWREGYEVVYAVRTQREGESWFKLTTAAAFYRLIHKITEVNIPVDTGDFRLLDRKVVNVLNQMREHHRFLRGMSAWTGFRQIGVPYKRQSRFAGETKYPLKRMLKLANDGITGFSFFPLRIATYLGLGSIALSCLVFLTGLLSLLFKAGLSLSHWLVLTAVVFWGGVQLVSLGILGEYIGRMYDEARGRPLYLLRDGPEAGK